tara:strand:- start:920 stop:1354 length:435 start_codon:yes stop_codon:yes gene_type:complete
MANNENSSEYVNSKVAAIVAASELAGMSVATDDQLVDMADHVPYFGKSDRDSVLPLDGLDGSWIQMFMEIENAFHKSAEVTKAPSDPNDVIRAIAKEIALAVHHYVAKAKVTTTVTTTTTGATTSSPPISTAGSGTGQGIGKLS